MATSKLNKEQYANIGSFAGIMLVYNSTNKDGELVQTAQHFFGADFEPADKSDNEIFRVIKNMVATMWHTIAEEKKLRADADGIRSKFRATTPAEIIICEKSGNRIKKYDLTDSVWARIGLVPTKVDLEKSNRDFQKTIHAAAKAIRNAMNFAPNLANLEKPADKSDNEIFRVIKNMVATMWHTIAEEKKLRADADGIRSKFRATTPAEIIICEKSGNRIKKYDLTDSVWARIGLVPTKVDLEKSNRDFQKTIHAAAKAIRNAMNFAPNLANLEKPAEKTTKTGKAEKVAEQPAGTVADESKKAA